MSRRIALAFSLALTVVVAFAVASFSTQAGWLQAQQDPEFANAENNSAQPTQPTNFTLQEPVVITEYVYQDIPVVVSRAAAGEPNAAVTPDPPTVLVNTQDASSGGSNSPNSSAQATQVDQAQQVLSWSHDGDDDDHDDFEDEVEDRQREWEHEAEHHDEDDEHEEEDD